MQSLKKTLFASIVTAGVVVGGGLASAQAVDECPDPAMDADCPQPAPPQPPQPVAQQPEPMPAQPQTTTYEPTYEPTEEPTTQDDVWYKRYGIGFTLGGGVEGFTGDSMRDFTSTGGGWDVRGTVGLNSIFAFEGSYIGSAQSIDAVGLRSNAVLVGNGVQGALRLNATTNMSVQPFLYAGLAWRHYNVTNTPQNLSVIRDKDDVMEVPLGVGLGYKYRGFLFDARGEFRPAFYGDLAPSLFDEGDDASMNRWGVNANIGYEF